MDRIASSTAERGGCDTILSSSLDQTLTEQIAALKEERDAVILAHNYQIPAVQEIADRVGGDSLELARAAAEFDAGVIVFCGVDFMAETAAILSPEKTVVLPAADACCPMAEMITAGEVRVLRERFPDAAVVAYVNTSAEVKAESDICCTSANAVAAVESLDAEEVIFLPPDRNLGRYVARFTEKKILPWDGYCIVHNRMTADKVAAARRSHPDAGGARPPPRMPARGDRPRRSRLLDLGGDGAARLCKPPPQGVCHRHRGRAPPSARKEVPGKGLLPPPLEAGGLRQHEEDRSREGACGPRAVRAAGDGPGGDRRPGADGDPADAGPSPPVVPQIFPRVSC